MNTKVFSITVLFSLCVTGSLTANTLPIHIEPFCQSEYDEIVWGCRLSRCIHVSHERNRHHRGEREKALIRKYENWLETSGRKLIEDWRAGNPISDEDAKYLPLAKTEFWDSVVKDWDGSRGYFRNKKFPPLTKFPEEKRALHEEYQAVIEAGLRVLHKIYNHRPLTDEDKTAFHEWALAYYCNYYIGGVVPYAIPAGLWRTFGEKSQAGTAIRQGDRFPNVRLYNPYYYWDQPEFDERKYSDVTLHLRADKIDELLSRFVAFAQYWEPAEKYPQIQPKCPPADAPDTESYRTLYNVLKQENKPVLFATWLINNDEGNVRLAPRLHLLHRAWRHKIGFVIAEGSVNALVEKNDLRFDPSMNEQARTHLLRSLHAPIFPTPYFSPVKRFFHSPSHGNAWRLSLINKDAQFLGTYKPDAMNGDFGGHLGGMLGWDKRLIEYFKNGFEADPQESPIIPSAKLDSVVPGRMAQCAANGYSTKAYNRYLNHSDAIGEIIAVDTDKHTVTLLREEYREQEYPVLALKERFPVTYNEYKTRDHRSNVTLSHWDDLAARQKAGNSTSARMIAFNVNVGIFLNGEEKEDESCLKPGDVASIVYLEGKGGYPHFIRALRFNFPPVFGNLVNTGPGRAELRGIDDGNLIVDQEITVTARSLSPARTPDPDITYKDGVCVFDYTPLSAGETVKVLVTLKDDGGTDFGGNDTTEVIASLGR